MSKRIFWSWAALAAACLALSLWGGVQANALLLGVLPFTEIGGWLRALSLSGWAGNAASLLAYALLSLAPVLWALSRRQKGPFPYLVSAYLFYLWYVMVNPALLGALPAEMLVDPDGVRTLQALPVMVLYMMVLGWLLLRAVSKRDVRSLSKSLRLLAWFVGALLIVSIFCGQVGALAAALRAAAQERADAEALIWAFQQTAEPGPAPVLMALVRFLAACAPAAMLLYMLPAALRLLAGCEQHLFAEENAALAQALARRARLTILVAVICMLGRGFIELFALGLLADTRVEADVPIMELLVALAAALFARYLEAGSRVYRENQMMI